MVVKKPRKIEAQVVEAIRRLQAIQGSTPREISSYIAQEYNVPGPKMRRLVQLALKRGTTYGILRRLKGGYYTYSQDVFNGFCLNGGKSSIEIPCKGRTTRSRYGRSKRQKSRSRYRSRRRKSRRRRRSSGRRRRRSRRRRRPELPKEIDGLESVVLSRSSKSNTPVGKERPASSHSTTSENSEEKHE